MATTRHAYAPEFTEICRLARAKNVEALRDYLQRNQLTINLHVNHITPIMKFALEKEHDIVKFLTDFFPVRLDHAVYGYAQAGQVEKVDALIGEYGHIEWAIKGYAEKGHFAQVDRLTNNQAGESALRGYAQGGHANKVNQLLRQLPARLLPAAMWSYAKSGYNDHVDELVRRSPTYGKEEAIYGYAQAGNDRLVDSLLNRNTACYAVQGYALAGNFVRTKQISKRFNVPLSWAVNCYMQSGYTREARRLIQRNSGIRGLFRHRHLNIETAAGCISNHMHQEFWAFLTGERNLTTDLGVWMVCVHNHFEKPSELLRFFSFAANDAYKALFVSILKDLQQHNLCTQIDYDVDDVLNNANVIGLAMRDHQISFTRAKQLASSQSSSVSAQTATPRQ